MLGNGVLKVVFKLMLDICMLKVVNLTLKFDYIFLCVLLFLQGLSCLKNLQHLSLSHNHLARVNDIENCMLLRTLNLQANNLQEVG